MNPIIEVICYNKDGETVDRTTRLDNIFAKQVSDGSNKLYFIKTDAKRTPVDPNNIPRGVRNRLYKTRFVEVPKNVFDDYLRFLKNKSIDVLKRISVQ